MYITDCIVYSTDNGNYFLFQLVGDNGEEPAPDGAKYFMSSEEMMTFCRSIEQARVTHFDLYRADKTDALLESKGFYVIPSPGWWEYEGLDLTSYQINEDDILNGIDEMDDYLIAGGASTTLAAVGSVTPAILLSKRRKKQKTEA